MSHVFTPAAAPSVAVLGRDERFPVRRIYCVGRNYADHAIEMGHSDREPPFFFMKPGDAIVAVEPGEVGRMPYPSLTRDLHHELELVVAIDKPGRDIPIDSALDHVFGYAVGLDMTRRDLQSQMKKQGRPWSIAKGFDASAPIGPITPATTVAQAIGHAFIELQVNGQPRQASHIDKMIWNLPEIIAHLSAAWALAPGDLIYTGTPAGVAAVVAGDRLEGRIEGLEPLAIDIVAA